MDSLKCSSTAEEEPQTAGVSSLIVDKCLSSLHNFTICHVISSFRKKKQSLQSLMSCFFFSLILSVYCSKFTAWLKLWRMGWFSSLNKDRHRCATLIQSGRYFKSYRKWLVQWVFADQLDVPTYGDAADQGCRLSVLRDWWYNLPGPPSFFSPPWLTSSPCLLSRGVFVLGFQILTRHRSVPWKSSWHTVRTVVPLPETQTKEDKLENRLCGTPRAFPCVTIEFWQHVFGVIALLLHVSGFASPLLWRDIILYIWGFYIISY